MGEQREGAVLGLLRESRVPGTSPLPLTLSVSPRVRGAAQETLGLRRAQLPLCVCLSVFASVSVSVWLSPSLPPLLELSFPDTDSPRILAPFPWPVSGSKAKGLRYPPTDLGAGCLRSRVSTHPPGMCSDWQGGAPPFLPGSRRPAPHPIFLSLFPPHSPLQLRSPPWAKR